MKTIREVLRLRYEAQLSFRKISLCSGLSLGAIKKYLERAQAAGITWPIQEDLSDEDLSKLLFPASQIDKYPGLCFQYVQLELKKHKGVTRQLLYEEYRQNTTASIPSYSQFCRDFKAWLKQQKPSLRHHHKAGEQCQVDYCGPTVPIHCPNSGKIRSAQVFVGVLSASNYTFAEATWSQALPDWIQSHIHMFEFFGGVPELTLTDNLKSGVTKACRYEPQTNATYQQLAQHYHTTIFPVRPYKPKDKGKAENAVLVVERWIIACLRHQQFFSLEELNQAVRQLLHKLNDKPFQSIPGNRKSQFEALDQPVLRALPSRPFEYFESTLVRVAQDYHFQFEQHFYSVPYGLAQKQIELKSTQGLVKAYYQSQLVATHQRSYIPQGMTTLKEHRPISHQKVTGHSIEEWLDWGLSIGPATAECLLNICTEHHLMRANRICTGIQSLIQHHGKERLEQACQKSLAVGHVSYNSLKLMLKSKLEQHTHSQTEAVAITQHDNIRGANYYHAQQSGAQHDARTP